MAELTGAVKGTLVLKGVLPSANTLSGHLSSPQRIQGTLSVAHNYTFIPPATTSTIGGVIVGEDLLVTEEGVLSIDKATDISGDNTRPITAAAVYTEVGNINALLHTI